MRTLWIEAASREAADSLSAALVAFRPDVLDQDVENPVVRVQVSGGNDEIVALLNAIQAYVTSRAQGPAVIGLDGRTYVMEPPTER